jgi:hypothetical protein
MIEIQSIKIVVLKYETIHFKTNAMEKKDLGSKKINNKQEVNEGLSGKNISDDTDSNTSKLKKEIEIDANGNEKTVQRARNIEGTTPDLPEKIDNDQKVKEGLNRGVATEKDTKKTVENIDRNSDITPNRYPNSDPDNHENRGNTNLDD